MKKEKIMEWVLRVAVAGEFIGHGALALGGKADWVGWVQQLSGFNQPVALNIILIVGVVDIILALIVLIHPVRPVLLWMAFWGFFTAILRPIVGQSIWDFVERFANWGAPLALFYLLKKE
ncbi:MAG: hypothetical protein UU24_C0007G0020 [Candidatus Nomurabacteria bacterium GW2011_GWA2_40_9]|uniref:DoxX family protein n=1 Tax=Candidatus Nomurabacteria bacterium GW2011_GWA2_40_9 TaxID=1618734 RepID=A0A0G0TR80_9BACT|nr:MAG: hypothetical protein UU24_C0007G0020 [Candidatus Nomurabacteria bacterium GW2011_GWA2_40_9]